MRGDFKPGELLAAADRIMRARWPTLQPHFYIDGRPLRAVFVYPGELRVHDGGTGALLARSRAGRPTVPASTTRVRQVGPAPAR